jgi:hypothetical protein
MAKRTKRKKDQWDRLFEQLAFHGMTQEEVLGQDGLIKQLAGRMLQRVLECTRDLHRGYEQQDPADDNRGDSRNGYSEKRVVDERC